MPIKYIPYFPNTIEGQAILDNITRMQRVLRYRAGQWHSGAEIKIDKLGYVIKDGVKNKTFRDGKITSNRQPKRIKIRNISGDETIKKVE
jgi:hypothetical protein